jgi:hypothetical protein
LKKLTDQLRSPLRTRPILLSLRTRSKFPFARLRAAGGLGLLFVCLTAANAEESEPTPSSQQNDHAHEGTRPTTLKSTALFMNWGNVFKGSMHPSIDPARVSETGQNAIQSLQNSWNVVFRTNGHGLQPYQTPKGIRIVVERARKEPMLLKPDRPWEERLHNLSLLQETGRLRCWYSVILPKQKQAYGFQAGRAIETGGQAFCYAESKDGITWEKPNLGIHTFNGSKSNNIVSFAHFIGSVFRDENGPPEERYKSFEFGKLPAEELAKGKAGNFNSYCLYGLVSPDGYHWKSLKNPLIRHFCDTQNVGSWDPLLKKYVAYFRDHQGGRAISRGETDDFHNWPAPQPLLAPGPEDDPDEDYYSNCYTTYPGNSSLRLLFPAIYHQGDDQVDVRLAASTEGRAFNWVSHQPIIELGAAGQFDSATIYAVPDLIRRADGKLALAYEGSSNTHNEGYFHGFYKDYTSAQELGWAIWDDGRLAGIEAADQGEFYTQSFRLEGDQIDINARTLTNTGHLTVEIVEQGKPIEGFSRAESIAVRDNSLWTPLRWNGKADLAELRGKKLQLHFLLNRAKLFGYRVMATAKASSR